MAARYPNKVTHTPSLKNLHTIMTINGEKSNVSIIFQIIQNITAMPMDNTKLKRLPRLTIQKGLQKIFTYNFASYPNNSALNLSILFFQR